MRKGNKVIKNDREKIKERMIERKDEWSKEKKK